MAWSRPQAGIHILYGGGERAPECSPIALTSVSVNWVGLPEGVGGAGPEMPDWLDPAPGPGAGPATGRTLRLYGARQGYIRQGFEYDGVGPDGVPMRSCPSYAEPHYAPLVPPVTGCLPRDILRSSGPREGPDDRINYLDAVPGRDGTREPEFWVLPSALRGGQPLLGGTCIPQFKHWPGAFSYRARDYSASVTTLMVTTGVAAAYGGVNVVQLPSGKWMLLLSRDYAKLDPADNRLDLTSNEIASQLTRHCANSDIVCYLADGPDFREDDNLVGPFWLVDGLNGLRPDELPSGVNPARLRVSVPGAVVMGSDLYVYYVFMSNLNFDDRLGDGTPVDLDGDGVLDGACDGSAGGDPMSGRSTYEDAIAGAAGPPVRPPFREGVACKRIDLVEFDRWLALRSGSLSLTDESVWELYANSGRQIVAPGQLLGRVRVWMNPSTWGSGGYGTPPKQRLEDAMVASMVDPAPVLCIGSTTGTDRIMLYFVASGCGPYDAGCGLWRAAGLDAGEVVSDSTSGTSVVAELGKDFAIRGPNWGAPGSPAESPDLVHGAYPGHQYLNPAPIQMPTGNWRVYSGGGNVDLFGPDLATFNLFRGTGKDGCDTE